MASILTLDGNKLIQDINEKSIDVLTPIKESYGEYTRNNNIPNDQNLLLKFIYNTLYNLGRNYNLLFLDVNNNIKKLKTTNASDNNKYIVSFNVKDKQEETSRKYEIFIDCNQFVSSYNNNYNMFVYKNGNNIYTDTNTYFIITLNKISLTQVDNLYTIFSKFSIFTYYIKQGPYRFNDNIYDIEYLITPSKNKLILNEEEKKSCILYAVGEINKYIKQETFHKDDILQNILIIIYKLNLDGVNNLKKILFHMRIYNYNKYTENNILLYKTVNDFLKLSEEIKSSTSPSIPPPLIANISQTTPVQQLSEEIKSSTSPSIPPPLIANISQTTPVQQEIHPLQSPSISPNLPSKKLRISQDLHQDHIITEQTIKDYCIQAGLYEIKKYIKNHKTFNLYTTLEDILIDITNQNITYLNNLKKLLLHIYANYNKNTNNDDNKPDILYTTTVGNLLYTFRNISTNNDIYEDINKNNKCIPIKKYALKKIASVKSSLKQRPNVPQENNNVPQENNNVPQENNNELFNKDDYLITENIIKIVCIKAALFEMKYIIIPNMEDLNMNYNTTLDDILSSEINNIKNLKKLILHLKALYYERDINFIDTINIEKFMISFNIIENQITLEMYKDILSKNECIKQSSNVRGGTKTKYIINNDTKTNRAYIKYNNKKVYFYKNDNNKIFIEIDKKLISISKKIFGYNNKENSYYINI
jgi:hypothetical protein